MTETGGGFGVVNSAEVQSGNGHSKEGKVSFNHIYNLGDSRGYFEVLGRLDYRAPQNGHLLFPTLVQAKKRGGDGSSENGRSREVTVVDLCCSYGINGTLLKYEVTLDDLYERYRSEELASLASEELARADAEFFGSRRREAPPRVVGIDVAQNAIRYALRAGLLDAGFAENLEEDEPTGDLAKAVSGADLLTVTGGIGYAWERTFDRLLGRMAKEGELPWVATFPLRMVDYGPIAEVLSGHGLVTEKLEGRTFVQRRFEGAEEQEYVLGELEGMGIDPEGRESAGYYHSEFYLSRPREEVAEIPIDALLGASLGDAL